MSSRLAMRAASTPPDILAAVLGVVASAVGSSRFPESDGEHGGLIQA